MFDADAARSVAGDNSFQESYPSTMPPLTTQAVAQALRSRLPDLDTLKLHKLLYYCQGYHLAHFGGRLFNDTVSAFDNGPVVGRFWYAEKNNEPLGLPGREPTESELNTIGYVVSLYGRRTGAELKDQTHDEAPYIRADKDRPRGKSSRIEELWMEDYFRTVAVERDRLALQRSPIAEGIDEGDSPEIGQGVPDDLSRLRGRISRLRQSAGRRGR